MTAIYRYLVNPRLFAYLPILGYFIQNPIYNLRSFERVPHGVVDIV